MSRNSKPYSRLYIERAALDYPHGQRLIRAFAGRPIVEIDDAHQVLGRKRQDYQMQKRDPAVVAIVLRPPFLYRAPALVRGERRLPVFYSDQARNCRYDCDYCFLQGMHHSAYPVLAVNSEDVYAEAIERAREGDFWLSIAYVSDILSFEPLIPFTRDWINRAALIPNVTIEVRTKGRLPESILACDRPSNLILTWSLSPAKVVRRYEGQTATLEDRIASIRLALERGFCVSIAIDPVLLIEGWREAYAALISDHIAPLLHAGVESVTYGAFRMGHDHMDTIQRARADSPILHYPFVESDGVSTYPVSVLTEIEREVGDRLRQASDSASRVISMIGRIDHEAAIE